MNEDERIVPCHWCEGSGWEGDDPCPYCNGGGEYVISLSPLTLEDLDELATMEKAAWAPRSPRPCTRS